MNSYVLSCNGINSVVDYTPQIISILGTILGAVLGWLLKYLQDNVGKTEFSVYRFVQYCDANESYAFNLHLFVCNHSLKPKYMTDIKISFLEGKREIFSFFPQQNESVSNFSNLGNKDKMGTLFLRYNEPQSPVLTGLFPFSGIQSANRILLSYKNERRRTKTITIVKDIDMERIEKYPDRKIF